MYDLYNESLITRARNLLTHAFLKSDYDFLLFIDADQSFEPEDIIRMVEYNKEIIAAPVPMKSINWENVISATAKGKTNYETYSGNFNINFLPNSKGNQININEPYEVSRVGTGMMLIKREVFVKLIENSKIASYTAVDVSGSVNSGEIVYAFWESAIKENILMSEDYNFCEMWKEIGGKIFIDLAARVQHHGSYIFKGSLLDR
jgi:hypothetical protein